MSDNVEQVLARDWRRAWLSKEKTVVSLSTDFAASQAYLNPAILLASKLAVSHSSCSLRLFFILTVLFIVGFYLLNMGKWKRIDAVIPILL
jgi:hypothetical protein